jgi:replicative DNA helicase
LESEQGLIGAALINDEWFQTQVVPEAFYTTAHRVLWGTMADMLARGDRLDHVTVTAALRAQGELEKVGGAGYLVKCTNAATVVEHAPEYAGVVLDNATRRRAINAAREIELQAYAGASIDDLAAAVGETARTVVTRSTRLASGKAVARDLVAELQQLYEQEEEPGFSTGFADLDKIMRFHHGEASVIAGRPGMGKTALSLDCTRAALLDGRGVYFASLEMSSKKLMKRVLSRLSGVDGRKFRKAQFTDADWPKLSAALGKVAATNLWIDDTPGQSSGQIRSGVHRIAAQFPVDLIVVDYVQKMREPGRGDRRQEIEYAMGRLVDLAKEVNAHVLVLAQLNRQVEQRKPPRPMISDLKESGRLEEDADNVLLLYREEYYRKDDTPPERRGVGEIIIGKCREGETGCVEVLWDGPLTSYRPIERYRT